MKSYEAKREIKATGNKKSPLGDIGKVNRAHVHFVWCVKEPGSGVGRRV